MIYKTLEKEELKLLKEIDRSEIIEEKYILEDKILRLEPEFFDIKGWDREEVNFYIDRLIEIYRRKGIAIGAFENEKIVGLGAIDSKLIGRDKDKIKLDLLYISKDFRGRGIGRKIVELLKVEARKLGGKKLYISASNFKNTVDFYISLGGKVAEEVDKELFDLEPEDIHMELEI